MKLAGNLSFKSPRFTAEIRGIALSRSSNLWLKFPSSIKEIVVNSNLWSLVNWSKAGDWKLKALNSTLKHIFIFPQEWLLVYFLCLMKYEMSFNSDSRHGISHWVLDLQLRHPLCCVSVFCFPLKHEGPCIFTRVLPRELRAHVY